tara:strand:+ start:590 stop:754 length:165 start_codon:yes stop_codon:yes gene_type:complete
MFNLNKFDTQKEIWEEPSIVDEEVTTKYFNMYPLFWFNQTKKDSRELEKMFKYN